MPCNGGSLDTASIPGDSTKDFGIQLCPQRPTIPPSTMAEHLLLPVLWGPPLQAPLAGQSRRHTAEHNTAAVPGT